MRLQCVSKQWLSIISSPNFRRLHSRRSAVVTGIFLPRQRPNQFVALTNEKHQHTIANRLIDGRFVVSLNSCNGLLCLGLSDEDWCLTKKEIYVYNPTTNQRRRIPELTSEMNCVSSIAIAFDPSKSDHYKLVCVCGYSRFWVFSSESRVWRNTGVRAPDNGLCYFSSPPYLNGGIHWYLYQNQFVCFDTDTCGLRPMPCIPRVNNNNNNNNPDCRYLGESGGHLHFIEEFGSVLLNVFEMENDYSGWVFKYQVDVVYVAIFYDDPRVMDMFSIHHLLLRGGSGSDNEEEEEEEGLVISVPGGKLIFWRLNDMSIKELVQSFNGFERYRYRGCFTSKHIDTLAFVC